MSESGSAARDEGARLLQAGNLDGALQHLEQAVRQDPQDAKAFALLGICRTRKGDPAGGIEALTQAARIAPGDAVLRYNLGVALSQVGRTAEAKPELQQALALNPNHAGARELLHRLESAPPAAFGAPAAGTSPPAAPAPSAADQPPAWGQSPIGGAPPHQPAPQPAWAPAPQSGPAWAPQPEGPPAWTPTPPGGEAAPAWTPAPASSDGPQHDAYTGSPAAMYYAQDQMFGGKPPGLPLRLLRGWGWGMLYGQWWTLWRMISAVLFGRVTGLDDLLLRGGYNVFTSLFFGSLAGLVIGAANLDEDQGVWVGVGAGFVILGLEFLLSQNPLMFINVIFFYFTGQYIGRGIAGRVQRPVA